MTQLEKIVNDSHDTFEEVLTNIIEDDDEDDDEDENEMSDDIDEKEKMSQPIENSDGINESEHTNEN